MEIGALKGRPLHRLSGGKKKRVALTSVLILDPDVLLLDELTAPHDLDSLEEIADHCFIFQNGQVVAQSPPAKLLGDIPPLERTGLLRVHRHVHKSGVIHTHPHRHHDHES
jgi:cobalt/nickel transport system ATP-binding protein